MCVSTCLITNCILEQNNHVYYSCMKQYIYIYLYASSEFLICQVIAIEGIYIFGIYRILNMFYTPQIFGFPNLLLENQADKSFLFCLLCSALQFSLTTLTTEFFGFFKIFLYNDVQLQFHGQHAFRILFTVFLYIVFMYT